MEQDSDEDLIEYVCNLIAPFRRGITEAVAKEAVARALQMMREEKARPFPDANRISGLAQSLLESIKPLGDMDLPIQKGEAGHPIVTGDGPRTISNQDFMAVLVWLSRLTGPSPSRQTERYLTADMVDGLINMLALKPPTAGERSYEIAKVLHSHVYGAEEGKYMKRAVDAVTRSWRDLIPSLSD